MILSVQRIKKMHPMNEGAMTLDVRNADGALGTPRGVTRGGYQPADDDDVEAVLFDIRDRQINSLPTTMTVAEALEDTLGPRR